MRRTLAILATTAVIGTGAAGALAAAQDNPQPQQSQSAQPEQSNGRRGALNRALERLTKQGTLTEQQAQAVRDAVRDEAKQGRASRKDRRAELRTIRREGLKVAADTIGISEGDLKQQLKSGKSIAQVAQEHNVDRQRVVDALVAFGRQKIDEAQAKGKLDEQQAARLRERLPDLVNRIVDHQFQAGAKGKDAGKA